MTAWLFVASVALAQGGAPDHAVVGFKGLAGGECEDRTAAQDGKCVDVVEFFPLDSAGFGKPLTAGDRATLRDLGALYSFGFEDLAYKWTKGTIEQTIRDDEHMQLPSTRETYQVGGRNQASYVVPNLDLYLGDGDWYDAAAKPMDDRTSVFFPHVLFNGPDDEIPAATVVLDGRFAQRLGANGRSFDFDLMDSHPDKSRPFFEQVFPFLRSSVDNDVYDPDQQRPLRIFRLASNLGGSGAGESEREAKMRAAVQERLTVEADFGVIRHVVGVEFEAFRRLVFVQASQFAMENFTTNQMRVIAAMTAISSRPDPEGADGLGRALVAAAKGETDTTDQILEVIKQDPGGLALGDHVQYDKLPMDVVEPWVRNLTADGLPPGYVEDLQNQIARRLPTLLRQKFPPPLNDFDPEVRSEWLTEAIVAGEDRAEVELKVMHIALELLMDGTEPALRQQIESWMLADHVILAVSDTYDASQVATPAAVVSQTEGQWMSVLGMHGYAPQPIPQGLGAVDPVSVCTTLDGVEALDEPSFQATKLDVLVAAPTGMAESPAELLWTARDRLPFLFVDEPALPEATELVLLGDGTALYRVRWTLWSGWHLFWHVVPDGEQSRVVVRTGAICTDRTVLSSRDLVPTVVRAGLLHGNFRPSTHETRKDGRNRIRDKPEMSDDEIAEAAAKAQERAAAAREKAAAAAEAAKNLPSGEDALSARPSFSEKTFEIVQEELDETTLYLRGLAQAPLEALGGEGLLVYVFDTTAPGSRLRLNDFVPKTPYTRDQERVVSGDVKDDIRAERRARKEADPGRAVPSREVRERRRRSERFVRTASWFWYFQPQKRDRPVQVSPTYSPKASVDSDETRPKWGRRGVLDFWVNLGGSWTPYYNVAWSCVGERDAGDNFSGDCDADAGGRVLTQFAGVEFQVMTTVPITDRPRLGLDFGFEGRMDVRLGGRSGPLGTGDFTFAYASRPAVGVLAGLRSLPRPRPLERHRPEARLWGPSRSTGEQKLARTQLGLRFGGLFAPGFNGSELTWLAEPWIAWSVRRKRSRQASFLPFYPGMLLGLHTRFTWTPGGAAEVAEDESGPYIQLDDAFGATVGVRGNFRLKKPAPPPEGM